MTEEFDLSFMETSEEVSSTAPFKQDSLDSTELLSPEMDLSFMEEPSVGEVVEEGIPSASTEKPEDYLPEKLTVAPFAILDIFGLPGSELAKFEVGGEKLDKKTAAFLVGMGQGMTDITRGVKQLVGTEEEQEVLQQSQNVVKALAEDNEYGGIATAGNIVGFLADPLSILVPTAKVKSVAKAVASAAGTSSMYGGLGYVDKEEGQTRLSNALAAGVLGTAFVGGIKGAGKLAENKKFKDANKVINDFELSFAKQIAEGKDKKAALANIYAKDPALEGALYKASELTKRVPDTSINKEQAKVVNEYFNSNLKQTDIPLLTKTGEVLETIGGAVSTRVKNISEPLFHSLRTLEYKNKTYTHQRIETVKPFLKMVDRLPSQEKEAVTRALYNGEFGAVENALKRNYGESGLEEFASVKAILSDVGDQLADYGRIEGKLDNYFPRMIKDEKGLLAALGGEKLSRVQEALKRAVVKNNGKPLSMDDKTRVINSVLGGYKPIGSGKPGYTKGRKLNEIPEHLLKYYEDPVTTLDTYIRNATNDLNKFDFFGKGIVELDEYGKLRLEDSVGNLVAKEYEAGNLTSTQLDELSTLLTTRFGVGETSPHEVIKGAKNVMYASLLGNPISAVTQLGDVGASIYLNGLIPTLKAVAKTVGQTAEVTAKDFGFIDNIAEEFAGKGWSKRLVDYSMKLGGFEAVDRLGKSTILNAALDNYRAMSKSSSGIKKIASKYGDAYGDEFSVLVDDLQKGRLTDRVKTLLFHEVSDVQPISLSEMPMGYLKDPNIGRTMYMLKTFMLKQMDLLRKDAYNKIKEGNVVEGLSNLTRYALIIGSTNTGAQYIKDWMVEKENDKDLPVDIGVNFFKTLGWSEYHSNKLKEGKVSEFIGDLVMPPLGVIDAFLSNNPEEVSKYTPVFGKVYYYYGLDGIAKEQEKATNRKFREYEQDLGLDSYEEEDKIIEFANGGVVSANKRSRSISVRKSSPKRTKALTPIKAKQAPLPKPMSNKSLIKFATAKRKL